jgi:hypothetical protein
MLFEQRRLCQCADTEIEREGHKRIKLTLRHLPAQPVHSPLEARKIGGQQCLRLLTCNGLALADIRTSVADSDRSDLGWAKVGGETFAFIGGDDSAASGRGD